MARGWGLSFGGRAAVPAVPDPVAKTVLVLWGRGGRATTEEEVRAAASASSSAGWAWRTVDPTATEQEVWEDLCAATVVVTHAGQNAVAEVAAARRPAVVVAQPRPHGEQAATAVAVDRLGVAVGLSHWPAPNRWPAVLATAVDRGGSWTAWGTDGGAHAAHLLDRHVVSRREAG